VVPPSKPNRFESSANERAIDLVNEESETEELTDDDSFLQRHARATLAILKAQTELTSKPSKQNAGSSYSKSKSQWEALGKRHAPERDWTLVRLSITDEGP